MSYSLLVALMSSTAPAPDQIQPQTPDVQRQNFLLTCRAHVRVWIDLIVIGLGVSISAMLLVGIAKDLTRFQGTLSECVPYVWFLAMAASASFASTSAWSMGQRRNPKTSLISLVVFASLLFLPILPALRHGYTVSLMFAPWVLLSIPLIAVDRNLTTKINSLGQLPSNRTPKSTRILRVLAIPFCSFLLFTCLFGFHSFFGLFSEAIASNSWPQTKANVTKCELVDSFKYGTLYDVNYQFSIDGQTYTGNNDGGLTQNQHSFSTHAKKRVAELKRNPEVLVSYHPDNPETNSLTTGVNADLLMSTLPNLYVIGLFLSTFSWLLIVHRRTTDKTDICRTFSPKLLRLKFVFYIAYAVAVLYFFLSPLLPGFWAFALALWISLSYTIGRRIMKAGDRDVETKRKKGKTLVWSMGPVS